MVWFKVDDGLPTSKKILSIPRRDRLAAVGLWTLSGAWSSKELTNGVIPEYMVAELGGTQRVAETLVTAALWSRTSTGYQFYAWEEHNPAKADVIAKREKNAEKLRNWRSRNQDSNPDVTEGVTGLQNGSDVVRNPAPDPTRPVPTLLSTSVIASDAPSRGSTYPAEFEMWWRGYPLKKAKGDALKAWNAARKSKLLPPMSELMEATRAYASRTDPEYLKHPGGWLRDRRWEDEAGDESQDLVVVESNPERDAWLAARGVSLEEYLERKDEPGWLNGLEMRAHG